MRGRCLLGTRAAMAVALVLGAFAGVAATPGTAEACGCFSPQQPPPGEVDFAVDQESEQIIFEVPGDGTITAHVLIRYQGKPESFAWLVPVPTAPELALSETYAFAILDEQTGPIIQRSTQRLCPEPAFDCRYHSPCPPLPYCPGAEPPALDLGFGAVDMSSSSDSGFPGDGGSPVEVLGRETIGSYDTVTFAAGDATAAVAWLRDNDFLVNETTAPFMQPYADAGMVFVASRLVPGADVDEIRPLRMTYEADMPMVPLMLTAIGAQPHLTVTTYVYGPQDFQPFEHPRVTVLPEALTFGASFGDNYAQVLARLVDEAGGDGFVQEYRGVTASSRGALGDDFCCGDDFDRCGVGGDGLCQCPTTDFDRVDCPDAEAIVAGAELVDALGARHARMTRWTTRISPEEMTFDPAFEPVTSTGRTERLRLTATRFDVAACRADVIDQDALLAAERRDRCSGVYCGRGECVVTGGDTPGCACDEGFVARQFRDLDGEDAVTCVPETPPVDLEAGGIELPDACARVDCGEGTCVDLNGFPACACAEGNAATLVATAAAPVCSAVVFASGSPGGDGFNAALRDLEICAPAPPACGGGGWYVPQETTGTVCASSRPADELLIEPPAPVCTDDHASMRRDDP
ncbi:MAG: DUF2330 domain-containing protein [Myxococcota bacterium]